MPSRPHSPLPPASKLRRGLALAGAGALVAAFALSRPAEPPPASSAAPPSPAPSHATSAAPSLSPARAPAPRSPSAIAAEVAEKNRPAAAEQKAFAADGWRMVDAPPPDPRLTAYDPALVRGREAELRGQLASTTAAPEHVGNLREIAADRGAEESTRTLAVEALGRVRGDEAQEALLSLLETLPSDDPVRRHVVPLLRPAALDDPRAAQLAARLDARASTPVERQQLAFTLALVGLRDGSALPRPVLDGLSPDARALLERMTTLAKNGGQ